MTFDPKSVEVTCVTLPKVVSKSHENTSKYVDTVTLLSKTWTKGHWPLDDLWPPHSLTSHVWLYPRIIVSKSHENTSKYVDTVTFFQKLEPKIIAPRWPLTPGLLRSHVWLYPGSLCRSPMEIHQCMLIQWSILQNTTYYIVTYYGLHTMYYVQNSDHIVSFWRHSSGETKTTWTQASIATLYTSD